MTTPAWHSSVTLVLWSSRSLRMAMMQPVAPETAPPVRTPQGTRAHQQAPLLRLARGQPGAASAGFQRVLQTRLSCNAVTLEESTALVLSDSEERFYREVNGADQSTLDVAAPSDFYELLGVEETASPQEIRSAYRKFQRVCHPDIAGEAATNISAILNRAYDILSDDNTRRAYQDAIKSFRLAGKYDGRPISRWAGDASESRAIFVDESVCIGCRQCTFIAPNSFFMEDEFGRARCHSQWADDEDVVNEAMDLCPVSCIFLVKRQQLALLEWMMKACKREDISTMARRRGGNFGPAPAMEDPFSRAEAYLRSRREAKIPHKGSTERLPKDVAMAGAIASAWLSLPASIRREAWPEF